jgi:hypothetical protein
MKVMDNPELEQKIRSFMDRKAKRFPELELDGARHERQSLLARVQDFAAVWPHVSHPRHSH